MTRSNFRIWIQWKPLLLIFGIACLIDLLPTLRDGTAVGAIKGLAVAVPAAVVFILGGRQKMHWAFRVIAIMVGLLFLLTVLHSSQTDTVIESAILSIFALGFLLVAPYCIPRAFRAEFDKTLDAPSRYRLVRSALRESIQPTVVASREWWLRSGYRILLALSFSIAAFALLMAFFKIAIFYSGFEVLGNSLRPIEFMGDTIVSALAIGFIGWRIGGRITGIGAALLWIFSGARLDYTIVNGPFIPTSLAVSITGIALAARQHGILKGAWLGAALLVVSAIIGFYWPTLSIILLLISAFTFWICDYAAEAKASFIGLAVFLGYAVAIANNEIQRLSAQSVSIDPHFISLACASGCDGGLPWEFFYPSAFSSAYQNLLTGLLTATEHWGDYQSYSIAPGWGLLLAAAIGAIALFRAGYGWQVRRYLIAISIGIILALPSHYDGIVLPSFSRLIVSLAPTFQFGAQMALVSSFFIALLGGIGIKILITQRATSTRAAILTVIAILVLLDAPAVPSNSYLANRLERVAPYILLPLGNLHQ